VANYFQLKHGIPAANMIHVNFVGGNTDMAISEFNALKSSVDAQLSASIQGYAITWTLPWRVGAGMSMTSAFSLGYDPKYVHVYSSTGTCAYTASVPYFNSPTTQPFTDLKIRPAMMIGGRNAQYAKAVIDKGALAAQTLPTGDGYFLNTSDSIRSVRRTDFQNTVTSWNRSDGLKMNYLNADLIQNTANVLFYLTGLAWVDQIYSNQYLPGAVADTLTSYSGVLTLDWQMSALEWLQAGATASYGTVVEPCNSTGKFPRASALVSHYFSGNTVLEAYWKSVVMPGEGIFVGDPLARPFGTRAQFSGGVFSMKTSILQPGKTYSLQAASSSGGSYVTLQSNISVSQQGYKTITDSSGFHPFYRLVSP
jgi:uncharacterized protein (TIGR03790 family)